MLISKCCRFPPNTRGAPRRDCSQCGMGGLNDGHPSINPTMVPPRQVAGNPKNSGTQKSDSGPEPAAQVPASRRSISGQGVAGVQKSSK